MSFVPDDPIGRIRTLLRDPLSAIVLLIAAGTVGAGLFQLVFPGVVLDIIDGSDDNTAKHFFSIVGMFMTLFGGLTIHALLGHESSAPSASSGSNDAVGSSALVVILFWAALQKFGASIAVGLGVVNDVFGALALLVAGFDLLSFVVIGLLARRVAASET